MTYSICSQRYTVRKSYILVSLILSSYSLEYRVKGYLIDSKGYGEICAFWNITESPKVWSISGNGINTCFPKIPEEKANCILLSLSYKSNVVPELYMNIRTETSNCTDVENVFNCTGKFNLSVNYPINKNDFKRVILPDEIPLNIYKKDRFYIY